VRSADRNSRGRGEHYAAGVPEDSNADLARLLDLRADGHEPAPEALLTALSASGVFIPVTSAGTVLFLPDNEQPPTLLGFTDAALGTRLLPGAAGMVHCDMARLRDILAQTGVGLLGVRSGSGQAIFPAHVLRDWASYGPGAELLLERSTDPMALALRDGLVRRLRGFPAVRSVWIARATWRAGGEQTLMLHIAVDEDVPSASADRLMRILLDEEVRPGAAPAKTGMIALNTTVHAGTIAHLDRLGLDTVRHDARSGEVRVISRAYDVAPQGPAHGAPPPAPAGGAAPEGPANGAAPRPRTGRRWFGASS
jgi:hypothetical protein